MKKKQRQRRRKQAMQQHMTPASNLRNANTWSNQQRWKSDAEMPKKPINWTHVNSWSMGTIAFSMYISFIRLNID